MVVTKKIRAQFQPVFIEIFKMLWYGSENCQNPIDTTKPTYVRVKRASSPPSQCRIAGKDRCAFEAEGGTLRTDGTCRDRRRSWICRSIRRECNCFGWSATLCGFHYVTAVMMDVPRPASDHDDHGIALVGRHTANIVLISHIQWWKQLLAIQWMTGGSIDGRFGGWFLLLKSNRYTPGSRQQVPVQRTCDVRRIAALFGVRCLPYWSPQTKTNLSRTLSSPAAPFCNKSWTSPNKNVTHILQGIAMTST